jgi:hypothetical protein
MCRELADIPVAFGILTKKKESVVPVQALDAGFFPLRTVNSLQGSSIEIDTE